MATALSKQFFDFWGMCSDENINSRSGTILSFDAVCMGSPVIIMFQKSKQTSFRILSLIRDHSKKVGKQGRSPTPADILVNI